MQNNTLISPENIKKFTILVESMIRDNANLTWEQATPILQNAFNSVSRTTFQFLPKNALNMIANKMNSARNISSFTSSSKKVANSVQPMKVSVYKNARIEHAKLVEEHLELVKEIVKATKSHTLSSNTQKLVGPEWEPVRAIQYYTDYPHIIRAVANILDEELTEFEKIDNAIEDSYKVIASYSFEKLARFLQYLSLKYPTDEALLFGPDRPISLWEALRRIIEIWNNKTSAIYRKLVENHVKVAYHIVMNEPSNEVSNAVKKDIDKVIDEYYKDSIRKWVGDHIITNEAQGGKAKKIRSKLKPKSTNKRKTNSKK